MSNPITSNSFAGAPIKNSWLCPKDRLIFGTDFGYDDANAHVIFKHPWLDLKRNEYRPPLFTRMCLDVREAERDRRLHKKARA